MELEIIFLRHAQSLANVGRAYPGFHPDDPPLSELGSVQAERLARRLADEAIDAIYASTLIRTCQTVEPTASALGTKVRLLPELREAGTEIAGSSLQNFSRLAPSSLESARRIGWESVPSLANESEPQLAARAVGALASIRSEHPEGGRVLVASHAAFFGFLLRAALGLSLPEPFAWEVTNCALTRVLLRDDGIPLLLSANDTAHLL